MISLLQRFRRTATAAPVAPAASETIVYKTHTDRRVPSWTQLKYLLRLLQQRERQLFLSCLVVLGIAVPVFAVRLYFQWTEVAPDFGGSYTEGLVGTPQYINPLLSVSSDVDSDLTRLLFSGLFQYNDKQELEPDLITNYVISEDQLTYTFFLRHDVQWHDGESLTADDVLFTVQAIQDPLYQSPLQSTLAGVQAQKLDDYSFSLILPEKFAPFLSTLTFGIVPEHLWYNVPAQNVRLTELNVRPVGSGPYQFDRLTVDKLGNVKSFEMVRNDEYYKAEPYLDRLTFHFYLDAPMAVDALSTKKVEGLGFIPKAAKPDIERKNDNVRFTSLRVPQYTAIFFNQKQSDVLKNDVVRKALAYAVDRETIITQVLAGEGEPIYTPILPGYVGHNAEVEKYPFNTAESIRLLEEDGWKYPEPSTEEPTETPAEEPAPTDATAPVNSAAPTEPQEPAFIPREKDGVKLEFTVATVDLPEYQSTLELLQQRWQEIGVKVNVDTYSPADIQQSIIKKRNYEALLFGEIVGSDPDPYPFWHSSQQDHPGLALAIFRDRENDQLLEEARQTSNADDRRLKYLHFQNNLASQVPAIFLYNPLYTYAVHQKVHGVPDQQYITVPSDRFSGITSWYIHTRRQWKGWR